MELELIMRQFVSVSLSKSMFTWFFDVWKLINSKIPS